MGCALRRDGARHRRRAMRPSGDRNVGLESEPGGCTRPHGGVAPSAFDLAMAFDPVTRSLIAEGCCFAPQSQLGALDTTWRWDGERWDAARRHGGAAAGIGSRAGPRSGRLELCNCGPMLALPALASWTGRPWELMERDPAALRAGAWRSPTSASGQLLIVGSAARAIPYVGPAGASLGLDAIHMAELDAAPTSAVCDGGDDRFDCPCTGSNDVVVTDHQPPGGGAGADIWCMACPPIRAAPQHQSWSDPRWLGDRCAVTGACTGYPPPRVRRRMQRLGAELDVLEMVPFSDPDGAYAPAVALERRARALDDEAVRSARS